jgi:hypothetical protein
MNEPPALGLDLDRARTCQGCGWQGSEAAMAASGPVGDSAELACPRCGEPAGTEMPSIEAIVGARRTPLD